MPRRLRLLAGPNFHDLTPITANSEDGFRIETEDFEGTIVVRLKGFPGADGRDEERDEKDQDDDAEGNAEEKTEDKNSSVPYFEHAAREGKSWSIQVQGRFLQPYTADDILAGTAFDRPLSLPWGFSAVTAFWQYMDPTLELDMYSATPSALSPLITTMPHFAHTRVPGEREPPAFPPMDVLVDDLYELRYADDVQDQWKQGVDRKLHFKNQKRRKGVSFGPEDLITADFVHGHLDITPESVSIQVPGGFSFDMMQYWDGSPVRFICCERGKKGESVNGTPWGKVFWCVAIDTVDEELVDPGDPASTESSSSSVE
ncbi:hypothetical protein EIP91_008405 [Steccherinum ochraceum]|uniref:Domain of unknown function at the cortex 1 domain-containing protein n=1 Tax=Steccherinum ochraceum TaxID=92696 RepID=A0A4R0R2Y0_9APHY|nr:hypothetical protein EIP91_008405 [Steccherinum ochraceum]